MRERDRTRDRSTRTGNQTKRIYPRVAKALLILRDCRSMNEAAKITGMTPESISVCLRNVEIKVGVRLFHRTRGVNCLWLPIFDERTKPAWDHVESEHCFNEKL